MAPAVASVGEVESENEVEAVVVAAAAVAAVIPARDDLPSFELAGG